MEPYRHPGGTLPVPTLLQIEDQIRWEMEATDRGVQRYRQEIAGLALSDTNPGKLALREILGDDTKGLVSAIRAAQAEAEQGITQAARGRPPVWWWHILVLPAETVAVVTARTILNQIQNPTVRKGGESATTVAGKIGVNIKTEIEFDNWRRESKLAVKEGRAERDLFKVLTTKTKKVDVKAFARWKKKITEIERLEWTRDQRLHTGLFLLDLATTHSGGWFEMKTIFKAGKTERQMFLTDHAKAAITDINTRLEINRPYLLPMICPPKPWKRKV